MSGEVKLNVSQSRGYESASLINIENKDGVAVVSSRVIAYDFDKQHKHVLESIDKLIKDMGGAEKSADLYIESKYQHPQNKQWYKEYLLTRDGFSLLVMGFTGK
ncbi:Rha family transcriptional regulator [Turicibacter sanguinis]|uniref:Rha family transcriptional regulator n=1 Tax=Turicibacter sanguinis TaxID=154288 RepID=UPI00241C18F3|nr:Rha family transcriptional regulator [Turicibacter sanguinis]